MKTVEIDEKILEAMFEHVEYLHSLVNSVLELIKAKKPDDWLTSNETAKLLRISSATLYNLRVYGKIPFSQIDGRVMFKTSDITEFMLKVKVIPSI